MLVRELQMISPVIIVVQLISTLTAASLFYSTYKPCKESSVPYLLGIPAGFGLLAVAFAASTVGLVEGGLILDVIFLLIQTYGLLFIALIYARRTRLKYVGESISIELAIPITVTVLVLGYALFSGNLDALNTVPLSMNLSLRTVMALAALYLVYETARNWKFTKKASGGFVTIAYAFLFVGQLGFLLHAEQFGDAALLLAYEGQLLGLLILLGSTHLAINISDPALILRRLGLTALAH